MWSTALCTLGGLHHLNVLIPRLLVFCGLIFRRLKHPRLGQMPPQPLLPILIASLASTDLRQRVPQKDLIEGCRKDRCRDVDQDSDPAVRTVREGLAAKEDRGDDPAAQVPREVRGDGDWRDAPDHHRICHPDDDGSGGGRDEGVCGVDAGPDDQALCSSR